MNTPLWIIIAFVIGFVLGTVFALVQFYYGYVKPRLKENRWY